MASLLLGWGKVVLHTEATLLACKNDWQTAA